METIFLTDFLDGGILREDSFRAKVEAMDWNRYAGSKVLIKGCSEVPIPTWAYLVITAQLARVASHVFYGEPCAAVPIFRQPT